MKNKTKISTKDKFKDNPRVITKDQLERLRKDIEHLGDISGVVYCHNEKAFVGGNQRSEVFNGDPIEVIEKFDTPTDQKTVMRGWIIHKGEKYSYREVAFTPEEFDKANIVANSSGGDWDWDVLYERDKEMLIEYGLPVPVYDYNIPVIESEDVGVKAGVSNKYRALTDENSTLFFSINRNTFRSELLTAEEKRIIWDYMDNLLKDEDESKHFGEILGFSILDIINQLNNGVLHIQALSERLGQ